MILSKTCIYGIKASMLLAKKKQGDYVNIRKLSEELDISFHFLTKVLQKLTKSKLLESYKGPNGGVRLSRSSSAITFMDIISSIDGISIVNECALGLSACEVSKACPLHSQWSRLMNEILKTMKNITLAELANKHNVDSNLFQSEKG